MVEVHFQYQNEDIPVSPNLNIFVACFTTCHGLAYAPMRAIGDSWGNGSYTTTQTPSSIGQTRAKPTLTWAITWAILPANWKSDDYIEEFVSGGPKNYGYTTKNGKVECKVRGFRLNWEGKNQLNYDVMKQNVLDEIQKPLLTTTPNPSRQKHTRLSGTLKTINCTPSPITNVTSSSMTRESWIRFHVPNLPLRMPLSYHNLINGVPPTSAMSIPSHTGGIACLFSIALPDGLIVVSSHVVRGHWGHWTPT